MPEGCQTSMKYCLQLSHQSWTKGDAATAVERTIESIQTAELAGFDSVWVTEDPDGWDAFAVLGAATRETTGIRLGTGVTNPYLRHPNLIAASVATLDRLSGGRAFLGLGRGQPEWYRDALGMNVDSPLQAVERTVSLLRQWWQPPHIASGEDPFPVSNWERSLGPVPAHVPPIYLAATGRRMLELAGRIADGVRFNEMASLYYLDDAISTFKGSAIDAGRDLSKLSIFVHPGVAITDDPEPVLAQKKAMVAMVLALPGMERQLEVPGIDVHDIMERVRRHMRTDEVLDRGGGFPELRRTGDLTAARREIPLALMNEVATVGSIEHVRARLAQLRAIGATHVFLEITGLGASDQARRETISRIL